MDPSFGHQELFQTLSQASRSSKSTSTSTRDKSNKDQQQPSLLGSHVDEQAVRRLGRKLSLQAHGGQIPPSLVPARSLERKPQSCFFPYDAEAVKTTPAPIPCNSTERPSKRYLLRRLTVDCKDLYSELIDQEESLRRNRNDVDRRSTRNRHDSDAAMLDIVHDRMRQRRNGNKGLLSAVFENNSESNTTSSRNHQRNGGDSTASPGTISTKETGYNGATERSTGSVAPDHVRGKCLTEPSEGTANDGLDNDDGNLIVHENDTIVVPKKNLRTLRSERGLEWKSKTAEFRVLSLQGQGTFAQVFQCVHVQTGEIVALKVIKNKATYTRQATIEIDIFQTLLQEGKAQSSQNGPAQQGDYRDHMVGLKAYFMHLDHLCLVFELLGMNLYEILKARQFKGLPLRHVREISRQAVFGIRYFAQKNVVHCDLKPENILMANRDNGEKLVSEGIAGVRKQQPSQRKEDDSSLTDTRMKTESQTTESDDSTAAKTCVTAESTGNLSHTGSGSGGSGSRKSGGSGSGSGKSGGIISNSSSSTIPISNPVVSDLTSYKIKLIDFGSACFEGHTSHSYIQSRFYRSPEVLIGLPYDSAIDMWSLGCIAAELFLGLPILPGAHEHDQLVRISEMIATLPEWMLEQGSKAKKCFVKYFPRQDLPSNEPTPSSTSTVASSTAPMAVWRLKTHEEYIVSLSQAEVRKKGGRDKLSKPPKNRYFKRKRLSDILILHAQYARQTEDGELLAAFIHFLYGLLDPDPWKRLTAFQASQHPFITGDLTHLRPRRGVDLNPKEENQANLLLQIYWAPPWDPTICRRKLQNVQKIRERQNAHRRHRTNRSSADSHHRRHGSEQSLSESLSASMQISTDASAMQVSGSTPPAPNRISGSSSSNSQAPWRYTDSSAHSSRGHGMNIGSPRQSYIEALPRDRRLTHAMQMDSSEVTPSYASMDGDSYSFDRPGVFPGSYGVDASLNSQGSVASFQSGSTHSTSQMKSQNTYVGSYQGRAPVGVGYGQHMSHNYQQAPPQVVIPGQLGDTVSVTSSIAMSEPPMIDQQQLALFQQQMAFFQQQQQQFAGFLPAVQLPQQEVPLQPQQVHPPGGMGPPMQPQVHPAGSELGPSQQFHQPQQLHQPGRMAPPVHPGGTEVGSAQMQIPPQHQQQPVMMMQSPTGGVYYVATSATGQPVILQPVGLWNQPGQQQPQPSAFPSGFMQQPPYQQHSTQQQYQQPPYQPHTMQQQPNGSFRAQQQQPPRQQQRPRGK